MSIRTTKPAAVTLPLTALRCLYKTTRGKKIVCEIDVSALKKLNEPNTIDEMVAEARLHRALGKTKSFSSAKSLVKELRS